MMNFHGDFDDAAMGMDDVWMAGTEVLATEDTTDLFASMGI